MSEAMCFFQARDADNKAEKRFKISFIFSLHFNDFLYEKLFH